MTTQGRLVSACRLGADVIDLAPDPIPGRPDPKL